MDMAFFLLMLLSLALFPIGLIRPRWVLRWKDEPTRWQVSKFCCLAFVGGFLGFGITLEAPSNEANMEPKPPPEETVEKKPETEKKTVTERETAPAPTDAPPKKPRPAQTPDPPPSDLPKITRAGGLGDSAARFHSLYRPVTGEPGSPPSFDAEGNMNMGTYERNYYMIGADKNVVSSMTLQFDTRRSLPRTAAWEEVSRHTPKDGRKVRTFTDTMGSEVTVFRSKLLAQHLPDEDWLYRCHPVGTYQVILQRLEGDAVFFGARIGTGVDYDDNDPGAIDC